MVGGVVGALDAFIGLRYLEEPLGQTAIWMLFAVASSTLVVPGGILGAVIGVITRLVAPHVTRKTLSQWALKLRNLMIIATILLGLIAFVLTFIHKRGIQVDAIDWRPVIFVLVFYAGCVSITRLVRRLKRFVSIAPAVLVALSVGFLVWIIPSLGRYEGVLPVLYTQTVVLSPIFDQFRSILDRDGDGYASRMCSTDCDCNDEDPAIFPAAIDVPDNGLDEDCSGSDLTVPADNWKFHNPPEFVPADVKNIAFDPPYNVVLIMIDTLRADHMGIYGYDRETSPYMDEFAGNNILFSQARAQGAITKFSIPVMFTGRYFTELKRTGGEWPKLHVDNVTLAELLSEHGYRTVGLPTHGYMSKVFGLHQGFDVWDISIYYDREPVHWTATADLSTDKGLAYIDELVADDAPWFLFLHYLDPHAGYVRHKGYHNWGNSWIDRYDQEILFTDDQIQRLFLGMQERGLWENTVVIITADHGEGIVKEMDHGFRYHGQTLFDNLIKVPLLIRFPGSNPRIVTQPVGVIDLMPTILALAGLPIPENVQGISLLPYLLGENPYHPPVFAEKPSTSRPLKAMVDWPYKIIWDVRYNRYSLYNLEADPKELENLADGDPEVMERMINQLQWWRAMILKEIEPID